MTLGALGRLNEGGSAGPRAETIWRTGGAGRRRPGRSGTPLARHVHV